MTECPKCHETGIVEGYGETVVNRHGETVVGWKNTDHVCDCPAGDAWKWVQQHPRAEHE